MTTANQNAIAFLEKFTGALTLGRAIKATREAQELTQAELAKKLGEFSAQYVSRIENDRGSISLKQACHIARVLGVSEAVFAELATKRALEEAGKVGVVVSVRFAPSKAAAKKLRTSRAAHAG